MRETNIPRFLSIQMFNFTSTWWLDHRFIQFAIPASVFPPFLQMEDERRGGIGRILRKDGDAKY